MVRKIQGNKPSQASSTTPVQPTKTVESSKVGGVDQVKGTEKRDSAKKIGRNTRILTPEQKEQLFALIEEEAEKMFGDDGLPEAKKKTVKGAVKMAIEAGMMTEEEEEKK